MKVLNTELYDLGLDAAVDSFLELSQADEFSNRLVSASDANVLVHSRRHPAFKELLDCFYWNLPDGMPSVWILKLKGAKKASRCSGPDFFKRILVASSEKPIRHFLCGGAEGVAEKLKETCAEWGNNNVVGLACPAFKEYQEEDYKFLANKINESQADVVWLGLGAPKQIIFASELSKYTSTKFIITIGAAIDFHIGRIKKAPSWIQKIGFEWLFRVFQEPRRLGKRYFKVVPLFMWYAFIGLFKRDK